jgi:hypothetical protein
MNFHCATLLAREVCEKHGIRNQIPHPIVLTKNSVSTSTDSNYLLTSRLQILQAFPHVGRMTWVVEGLIIKAKQELEA